jgi:hypothetical protein
MDILTPQGHFERFCVVLLALTAITVGRPTPADESSTAADAAALHEFALASPELQHMNEVLATEMRRIMDRRGGTPALEVTKYMNTAPIDLGDMRIPLHLRFIERQRREFVAGITMAKRATAQHCINPDPTAEQLQDPAVRAQILDGIKCQRQVMDVYQAGTHDVNQAYEAMLLELMLPPHTKASMLARAHASTVAQDDQLASSYVKPRELLQAKWDFFTYLDAHIDHIHYLNGAPVSDDPGITEALQKLSKRAVSLAEQQ